MVDKVLEYLEQAVTFFRKKINPWDVQKTNIIYRILFVFFPIFTILTFITYATDNPPVDSAPTQNPLGPTAQTASPSMTLTVELDDPTQTPISAMILTPTPVGGDVIVVGAGDISSCQHDNDELTAQLLDDIPGTVFTTGDNAYPRGTLDQFLDCYEPTWGRHRDRTKPVPGNNDYDTRDADGYFQYFDEIDPYYAYNLGSWRIYALNSEIDISPRGDQVAWLREDLAAHPSQCVLAYWHQPRWSSSWQYGSDRSYQILWQMLYEAGAELVINGHGHHYERFAEMNADGEAASTGLREIVVGTGGASFKSFGRPLPTSQVRNSYTHGVLKLTLSPSSYSWEFVPVAGKSFTDSGTTNCH